MEPIINPEEEKAKRLAARKKNHRKIARRRMRRFLICLLFLGAVAFLIATGSRFGWKTYFSNLIPKPFAEENFPITVEQRDTPDMIAMKNGVAVLNDGSLNIYDHEGLKTGMFVHKFANPRMQYCACRLLITDIGGVSWMVTDAEKILVKGETSGKGCILSSALNEKGMVAVARQAEDSDAEVTVYNAKGEEMFVVKSRSNFVTSVGLNPKGTTLVTTGITDNASIPEGVLNIYDMTGKKETKTLNFPGETIIALQVASNKEIDLATDKGAYRLDSEGNILYTADFSGKLPMNFAYQKDGCFAVAFGSPRDYDGVNVSIYSNTMELLGTVHADNRIYDMRLSGDYVYILWNGHYRVTDLFGLQISAEQEDCPLLVAPWKNKYYYCLADNRVYRYTLKP